MNLGQIRAQFEVLSGRSDLVNADGSDNGADFHINAGLRYLDRLIDHPKMIARYFKGISSGTYIVTFEHCRSILEVWVAGTDTNGDRVRLPLTKYEKSELQGVDELFFDTNYVKMPSDITGGWPKYYAPAQLRMAPDTTVQQGNQAEVIAGFLDVAGSGSETYNGIILMPPANDNYTIEVVGKFYSKELSSDTDLNFWSEVHPEVLLMAAQRSIEVFHRNTAGVQDWEGAIKLETITIDFDGVAEESADIDEMEG
jgi:hypothetical protein